MFCTPPPAPPQQGRGDELLAHAQQVTVSPPSWGGAGVGCGTCRSNMVVIREVASPQELKRYIRFPFELYQADPYWVPPLFADEKTYYNPQKNPNLRANPYQLFLAYQEQRVVGRVMGLINQRANQLRQEKLLRWTFLDAIDDPAVTHALLRAVENWGQAQGMEFAVGPRGFSDDEPQGAIVEGFDLRAQIAAHYNRPHLIAALAQAGYGKDVDWVCYRMEVPAELPRLYQTIYKRLQKKPFTCRNLKNKAEMRQYIIPVLRLLNDTYKDLYGFTPLYEEEFQALAEKYLPILMPRFVHIIENQAQELIGFSVVMPDVTAGLQKARGRLFPFGFWHILRAMKTSQTLQFLLIGIKEEYRKQGLLALFAMALLKEVQAAGITVAYSHLQLEDNRDMNTWLEQLDGKIFRRYRAFIKKL